MTTAPTPVVPKAAKAEPKAAPLTVTETLNAFASGGVVSTSVEISEGVVEKTVTIGGETFKMTVSQGTNRI